MAAKSDLGFKGERRYLHSTSVFDDICRRLDYSPSAIDFTFNRQTANQVTYEESPPADASALVATWKDARGTIYIVDSGDLITECEPYDEAKLVEMFSFHDDRVLVPGDLGNYSRIEGIVAAFKHMLQRRSPDRKARYVFARLKLDAVPANGVTVQFGRTMGEFYQANLLDDDGRIGQLFYGVWK